MSQPVTDEQMIEFLEAAALIARNSAQTWKEGSASRHRDQFNATMLEAIAARLAAGSEPPKGIKELIAEYEAIVNCSPQSPWHGCEAQRESNLDHYDGHRDAAREVLVRIFAAADPPTPEAPTDPRAAQEPTS